MLAAGTLAFLVLVAEPAARTVRASPLPDLRPAAPPPDRADLDRTRGRHPVRRRSGWCCWPSDIARRADPSMCSCMAASGRSRPIPASGWSQAARLVLALVLGVLILLAGGAPAGNWRQPPACIALLGLIGHAGATPGLGGRLQLAVRHGASAGGRRLAWRPAGARHAAGAKLAPQCHPAWRAIATRAATLRFGWLGVVCVAALLASGVLNSWNLLAGPRDLVATDYGRLLLAQDRPVCRHGRRSRRSTAIHLTPRLAAPAALRALAAQQPGAKPASASACCCWSGRWAPWSRPRMCTPHVIGGNSGRCGLRPYPRREAMADVTIDPGRAGRGHRHDSRIARGFSRIRCRRRCGSRSIRHAAVKSIEKASRTPARWDLAGRPD